MKLLPLILLASIVCNGQSDSQYIRLTSPDIIIRNIQPTYDTSRVMIFYADTSRYYTLWPYFTIDTAYKSDNPFVIKGKHLNDTTFYEPDHNLHWQFGYELKKEIRREEKWKGHEPYTIEYIDTVTEYLDDRKRPLSKSLVIIQTVRL